MGDDSLSMVWKSNPPADKAAIMSAVKTVLEEDRAARVKERWVRCGSVFVVAVLCPILVWCAASGITPLVRGGYALMAIGAALMVALEWVYLSWSRQALPGAIDARSQLQKTGFLLARQASLLRASALWGAPIFVGTALIGVWVYQERSDTVAYLLWALSGAAWLASWANGRSKAAKLHERTARLQQVLSDLE